MCLVEGEHGTGTGPRVCLVAVFFFFLWASEPLLNKIKWKCLTDFQSCYLAAIPVSNAEMAETGLFVICFVSNDQKLCDYLNMQPMMTALVYTMTSFRFQIPFP